MKNVELAQEKMQRALPQITQMIAENSKNIEYTRLPLTHCLAGREKAGKKQIDTDNIITATKE